MRNDTQLKVTYLVTGEEKGELHFDYYNKEDTIVGTVSVDTNGKLEWAIWNKEYEEHILLLVSVIFGSEVMNNAEYMALGKKEDPSRFARAQEYIKARGLYVNYQQDYYDDDTSYITK